MTYSPSLYLLGHTLTGIYRSTQTSHSTTHTNKRTKKVFQNKLIKILEDGLRTFYMAILATSIACTDLTSLALFPSRSSVIFAVILLRDTL